MIEIQKAKRDALIIAEAVIIKKSDRYWTSTEHDLAILKEASTIFKDNKRFYASEKVTQTIIKPGTCRICGKANTIRHDKCFSCTFIN